MNKLDLARVSVVGPSGSGKTTLSRQLADSLGAKRIELDAFWHGPNWVNPPRDLFVETIRSLVQSDAWVADGKYASVLEIIWERATCVIWLDYPRWRCTARALWRTTRRAIGRTQLWNGNKEPLRGFFARDGVIRYGFRNYSVSRQRIATTLSDSRFSHLQVIRVHGPRELRSWLQSLHQG
jgi:adenylate kinase family enzyme